jgi:protein arginine N-methyltransferase 1
VYSVASHLDMVTDWVRTGAYREALRREVRSGCAVADIGTGTGIFAVFACEFGARRVYAIEPDSIVEVAREVAAANGVAERLELISEMSTRVELPEKVDVIVSDIGGVLPLFGDAVRSRIDARERLLADGGVLIPAREPLWVTLAEAREPYRYDATVLEDGRLGLDLSGARRFAVNEWRKVRLAPEELLAEPQLWADLDYRTIDSPDVRGEVSAQVTRDGVANGLCIWFDKELTNDVQFSNAPGEPETIYGQAFFPLREPIAVTAGDGVTLGIEALLVGEDYVWRWRTQVTGADGALKASLDQSTVQSVPLPLSLLRRREASHRAALGIEGEIDRFVLTQIDGQSTLTEIAERVVERFPGEHGISDLHEAFQRVARLSEQYSR